MWDGERSKDEPEQHGRSGVQQDVVGVVQRRVESRDAVLHPETQEDERVVLGRCAWRPTSEPTVNRLNNTIRRDVVVVIPDPTGAKREKMGADSSEEHEKRGTEHGGHKRSIQCM